MGCGGDVQGGVAGIQMVPDLNEEVWIGSLPGRAPTDAGADQLGRCGQRRRNGNRIVSDYRPREGHKRGIRVTHVGHQRFLAFGLSAYTTVFFD